MKKFLAFLLVLCLTLSLFSGFALAEVNDTVVVNIFHTNDIHGSGVANATNKMIRYSQIATIKDSFENSILVDGGDFTQGSVYVALTDGLGVINAMRLAGYDVATLGNHEFTAYRTHFIRSLVSESGEGLVGSPVAVVANNVTGDEVLDTQPSVQIIERGGVKVGFFGLATPTTLTTGNPAVNVGITIGDIVECSKAAVAELEAAGADVIVGLVHLGYSGGDTSPDGMFSNTVAQEVPGIDLLIDAHYHQSLMGEKAQETNGVRIVSTGTAAAAVGHVTLTVDATTHEIVSIESAAITAEDALANYAEREDVKAYLDTVLADVDAITSEVIAHTTQGLYGGHYRNGKAVASIPRRGETNAIALEADGRVLEAKKYFAGTEYENLPIVGLVCGGSCRAVVPANSDVTVAQIMNMCLNSGLDPSSVYVKTTGAVLWEAVEWGLSCMTGQDPVTGAISANGSYHGRYPNLSGANYVYDIRNEGSTPLDFDPETYKMGSRLVSLTLADGTEITKDSELELILCTNDFELGGGDGYLCFQRAEEAGKLERIGVANITFLDATCNYIKDIYAKTGDVFYPLTSGRVTVISDYDGRDFNCVVSVQNADETPVANAKATLYVNYGREGIEWVSMGEFTTDENGQFTAVLKAGPQETKVVIDGVESSIMYVDNIAGMLNTTLVMK